MKISIKKKIILALLLLAVVATGIAVYIISLPQNNQDTVDVPVLQPRFLLSSNTEVSLSTSLLDETGVVRKYTYNEVLDFNDSKAVVTKQNVIYLVEFNDKGEVVKETELGVRPDMVLSMARKLLVDGSNTYFLYVIPLRGFRLFQITDAGQITEKYYDIKEFFRLYSDNDIFISNNKIVIPNGDLNVRTIDLSTLEVTSQSIDPATCGAGNWQIDHNKAGLFVLKSADKICVFNYEENNAITTLPLSGNLWFRFVSELNILLAEEWQVLNNFPASIGKVDIYSLDNNEKVGTIDLSSNADFMSERAGSPGGYSLIGDSFVEQLSKQLYLYARAGENHFATVLNETYEIEEFRQANGLRP